MAEISDELDQMTVAAIDEALYALEELGEVPVLLVVDCEDEPLVFSDDEPDKCYRAACDYVAGLKDACARYALVYEGVVADDGGQGVLSGDERALLFEFAERGMEQAWSGYVLFREGPDGVECTDPAPAGEEELLFG